ncbi:MAG: hypothetical protein H0X30_17345 [Anaerolineae bacterium]|nr:hypothetical protein [Anaerolineae bacterium]
MVPDFLHILYTSNLRGDLDMLPRLQTFIRYLKSLPVDDEDDVMICAVQPQTPRVFMLDLGHACAPDVWHCKATDGRSTLIALDAMGYHAANVADSLTPESRIRLRDNLLGMALVDSNTDWSHDDLNFTSRRGGSQTTPSQTYPPFNINLTPASVTEITSNVLQLADVQAGQAGTAQVSFLTGSPRLIAHGIFDLPTNTAPDPTIAATVDFIRNEARFYSRNHSQN